MPSKYKPDDRVLLKYAVPPQAGTIIERALADEDGDWLLSRDGSMGSVVRYESELEPLAAAQRQEVSRE